jgi:hypothetical protein
VHMLLYFSKLKKLSKYSITHDLTAIYNKIDKVVEEFFKNEFNDQSNFRFYPNPPKMNDKQIISLSLCAEILGIDSENYFLSKLKTDYSNIFPDTHITRYNKRSKI